MPKKTQTNNRQSAFMSMLNTNKVDENQENTKIAQIEIAQIQKTQIEKPNKAN